MRHYTKYNDWSQALWVNLAIYVTGSTCLFSTGHWVGGTFLALCAIRVAIVTGL